LVVLCQRQSLLVLVRQEFLFSSESRSDYLIVLLRAVLIIRGVVIGLLLKFLLLHLEVLRCRGELHLSVNYLIALIHFPEVLFLRWDSSRLRELTIYNVHVFVLAVFVLFDTLIHHILL